MDIEELFDATIHSQDEFESDFTSNYQYLELDDYDLDLDDTSDQKTILD